MKNRRGLAGTVAAEITAAVANAVVDADTALTHQRDSAEPIETAVAAAQSVISRIPTVPAQGHIQ